MPSFDEKKAIRVVITLGQGTFGAGADNVITLEGFRTQVDIAKAGGVQMSTLRARVYGVKASDMNSVTTLQMRVGDYQPNTIDVFALEGSAETLVFSGNIVNAWGDYQSMPDVFLNIQAQAAYRSQIRAVPPRSFKGDVDVASIMSQIARSMGLTFENNGVNVKLSDVYLANTDTEQAKELARIAGIGMYLDNKTLAITPPNMPREQQDIPVISPTSGMVGYPTFDSVGVNFQSLFNPAVIFGGLVKIETDILRAAGQWVVSSLSHRLQSETPNGAWFSTIRGTQSGIAVTSR